MTTEPVRMIHSFARSEPIAPRSLRPPFGSGRSGRLPTSTSLAFLALSLSLVGCASPPDTGPTGSSAAGVASLDQFMTRFIARWGGVGGSLAVAREGRLVYARGFGLADIEARQPVEPASLFRIGSVSKTFTAVGILALVEDGRLDLDTPAFGILSRLRPSPGQAVDPRLAAITLRHLLTHTAGWDRALSGSPTSEGFGYTVASALGVPAPPDAEATIRYVMGRPLDFDPGSRYAYSNLGYLVLGRVIEEVSGRSYEEFMRETVLLPMGLARMRQGRTRLAERAPGEVHYYDFPGTALVRSVFPEDRGLVPYSYGGFYVEANDASGGWLASPVDLVRFASLLDGRRGPAYLGPRTIESMVARPPYATWDGSSWWHGLGWVIQPDGGGLSWSHNGSVWTDWTTLYRRGDGTCWAVSFNRHGSPDDDFQLDLYSGIDRALGEVVAWPNQDLSPEFFPEGR